MRQDENYPLRPVGRPVVGVSGTMGPRQTNCREPTSLAGGSITPLAR